MAELRRSRIRRYEVVADAKYRVTDSLGVKKADKKYKQHGFRGSIFDLVGLRDSDEFARSNDLNHHFVSSAT